MFSSQKFQKPVTREFVGRFEINFGNCPSKTRVIYPKHSPKQTNKPFAFKLLSFNSGQLQIIEQLITKNIDNGAMSITINHLIKP